MQNKEKKTKKVVEELKVCVRKLPPNLPEEVFMRSIAGFKETFANFYFFQGKNKEKYAKFGRAYITFQNAQGKNTFLKDYKPMFIDDKGNRYMAKVEMAFYQKDWKNSKSQVNPKEGTYLESDQFKAFLERLKNPKKTVVNSENFNRGTTLEDVSAKKTEKTSLVLDIEKRLNDKRMEKEAKKRKEREKDEKKYTPKTVIVYQKKK